MKKILEFKLLFWGVGFILVILAGCSDPADFTQSSTEPADQQVTPTTIPIVSPTVENTIVPVLPTPTDIILEEIPKPAVEAPTIDLLDPRSKRLFAYLNDLEESGRFMGSVLVAHGGEILVNDGYGLADLQTNQSNSPQTQFRIASITKQFTAAAVLKLQEEGLLDINDPLSKYLPGYPNGDQITIHHLLTNSSGVPNYEELPNIQQASLSPISLDALINTFSNQPLTHHPGQQFTYSSSGYVLLTKIIEVVTGQTYADFIEQALLLPAGMGSSGYEFLSPNLADPATGYRLTPGGPQRAVTPETSWLSGAGALYSTTGDMYRWDRILYGEELLNAQSLASMFTPWVDAGNGAAYGYGWQLGQTAGRSSAFHGGAIFGVGSFLIRFPEDDAFIIVLGNGTQLPPRQIATDLAQILFSE